jgi:hypothetical protein
MNELTPRPQSDQLAKTTSNEVSAPLWRLLVHEPVVEIAVDEVCRNPVLHDEVRRAYPVLASHAAGCGPMAVSQILGKLFAVYPQPERSDPEWLAFWQAYQEDLGDLPAEAVEDAVKDYRRSAGAEFFPKPGPLRALALKRAEPICKAAYRAKRCAESLPRQEPTPETLAERQEIARWVRKTLNIGDNA